MNEDDELRRIKRLNAWALACGAAGLLLGLVGIAMNLLRLTGAWR